MGQRTLIAWADSTSNLEMGCDGCELYNQKAGIFDCYAYKLVTRYAGRPGWPASFDQPALFPERVGQAVRWRDLTGADRPDKPWLNGLPRMIFLDDLGDTFTESLPLDWLMPHIPAMEASPHIWLFLTKRVKRMRQYFDMLRYVPANFKLGTTVTGPKTMGRLDELSSITGAQRWVSFEPVSDELAARDLRAWFAAHREGGIDWAIFGGMSDTTDPRHRLSESTAREFIELCRAAGTSPFLKQMGSVWAREHGGQDAKGSNWDEWPQALRVREVPRAWRDAGAAITASTASVTKRGKRSAQGGV